MEHSCAFLKWAGGKRWLAKVLFSFFAETRGIYYEPFLGSGSMFFASQPKRAFLSDLNLELIKTYNIVKSNPIDLLAKLRIADVSEENYYKIRNYKPKSDLNVAFRMIYLNRTAFNGLYRINRSGKFNVPYGGRTLNSVFKHDLISRSSLALKNADVSNMDFYESIVRAKSNDIVYCDPAYTVSHTDGSFLRYNEIVFSWNDQIRLRDASFAAMRRGATVIVSNANHHCIHEIYHPFKPLEVQRGSMIGAVRSRGKITESLFVLSKSKNVRLHFKKILSHHGLIVNK